MYLLALVFPGWKSCVTHTSLNVQLYHYVCAVLKLLVQAVLVYSIVIFMSMTKRFYEAACRLNVAPSYIVYLTPSSVYTFESKVQAVKIALGKEKIEQLKVVPFEEFKKELYDAFPALRVPEFYSAQEALDPLWMEYILIQGSLSEFTLSKLQALKEVDALETITDGRQVFSRSLWVVLGCCAIAILSMVLGLGMLWYEGVLRYVQSISLTLQVMMDWGAAYPFIYVPFVLRAIAISLGIMVFVIPIGSVAHPWWAYLWQGFGVFQQAWMPYAWLDYGWVACAVIAAMSTIYGYTAWRYLHKMFPSADVQKRWAPFLLYEDAL